MISKCPNCEENPNISLFSRLFWGPAIRKQCENCRVFLSMPWFSLLLMLPFLLLFYYLGDPFSGNNLLIYILAFVISSIVHVFVIPIRISKSK